MDDLNQNAGGTPTPAKDNVIVPDKIASSPSGGTMSYPPAPPMPPPTPPPMPPAPAPESSLTPPVSSPPPSFAPADKLVKSDDSLMPHKQVAPSSPETLSPTPSGMEMPSVLPEMEKHSGKKIWLGIMVGVLVLAAGYVLYQYYVYRTLYGSSGTPVSPSTTASEENTPVAAQAPTVQSQPVTPDEVGFIQSDLDSHDLENLGSEAEAIEQAVK